jgi:multiple sugar transport system permease protein
MTLSRRATPYLLLAPVLVFAAVFFLVPVLFSLGLTVFSWNSLGRPRFVGAANYAYLLTRDPLFWLTLKNTALFVGGTILVGVPLAMALAVAVRRSRRRAVWRSLYWLPGVTNVAAVAYVWQSVLADHYGLLNRTLALAGIPGPAWIFDPGTAMAATILVFVWFHVGQDMLLLSAALDQVDEDCEDAARIDGASPWEVFRHVTLPLMKPALLFVTLSNLVKGVGYFALMLVLTGGGPVNTTNVAALHIYDLAFGQLKLGLAAAAAWLLLVAVALVAFAQLAFMRRGGLESYG